MDKIGTSPFAPVLKEDGKAIIDIFNHYVENSFAANSEDRMPYEFFDLSDWPKIS